MYELDVEGRIKVKDPVYGGEVNIRVGQWGDAIQLRTTVRLRPTSRVEECRWIDRLWVNIRSLSGAMKLDNLCETLGLREIASYDTLYGGMATYTRVTLPLLAGGQVLSIHTCKKSLSHPSVAEPDEELFKKEFKLGV